MPALSFQGGWLDKLLSGSKQQTTRPQTDRFKVGDIAQLYIEQRRRIIDKPLRSLTDEGYGKMEQLSHRVQLKYPAVPFTNPVRQYPAHFLGKVIITEVFDFKPWMHQGHGRHLYYELWAMADGFKDFAAADEWFTKQYGENWMQQAWTVIRWGGWAERYFEQEVELNG